MVGNINPREEDFEESVRALNYTAVAREVKTMRSRIGSLKFRSSKKIRTHSVLKFDRDKGFENKIFGEERNYCSSSVIVDKRQSGEFVLKKDYLDLKKKMNFIIRQNSDIFNLTKKLYENIFFDKVRTPKKEKEFLNEKGTVNGNINMKEEGKKKNNKKNKKEPKIIFESPKEKDYIKKNPRALLSVKARPLFSNHDEYQNYSESKILQIINKKEKEEKKCKDFYLEKFLNKD